MGRRVLDLYEVLLAQAGAAGRRLQRDEPGVVLCGPTTILGRRPGRPSEDGAAIVDRPSR